MSETQIPELLSPQLIKAVKKNDVDQLKGLQEAGECFSTCDTNDFTLLHLAVLWERLEVLDYLLTVEDIPKDALNCHGNTVLIVAFQCDNQDFSMKLIENNCDINITDRYGETPLHCAIWNEWTAISENLIEKGADVNSQKSNGETPFHLACEFGLVDEISMLLFYGADPTIITNWGKSALDMAAFHSDDPNMQEILFNCLFRYMQTLHLDIFTYTMEHGTSTFPKLLDNTFDIRYNEDDLAQFCHSISIFKTEWLKMFIEKFDYVIQEMFVKCSIANVFRWQRDMKDDLQTYIKNVYVLFESDLVRDIVEELNSSKFSPFCWVIYSFDKHPDQLDSLTEVICCMLSHGVDIDAEAVDRIFMTYGYCELFKIMLHMDIKKIGDGYTHKYLVPHIIHDVDETIEIFMDNSRQYDLKSVYMIFDYFALPELVDYGVDELDDYKIFLRTQTLPVVPSLAELARNSAREHIINRYDIKNSMQFYTTLQHLPIAEAHRKIIAFETKLYPIK